MFWKKLEQKGNRGKGIIWNGRWKNKDEIVMVDFYFLGFIGMEYENQQILERGVNIAEDEFTMSIPSMFFILYLVKLGNFGKKI